MDTDRLTVPVNPFTALSVMVDVPEEPDRIEFGVTAPADIEKSAVPTTWKVILAVERGRRTPVPDTVTT